MFLDLEKIRISQYSPENGDLFYCGGITFGSFRPFFRRSKKLKIIKPLRPFAKKIFKAYLYYPEKDCFRLKPEAIAEMKWVMARTLRGEFPPINQK